MNLDGVLICPEPALQDLIDRNIFDKRNLNAAYDSESAGLDLYNIGPDLFIPGVTQTPYADDFKSLSSNSKAKFFKTLMPTGIKVRIPRGFVGLIKERGSVVKTPLTVRAGVIDSGYTGEIFVNIVNLATVSFEIKTNAKSPFQLIVVPCDNSFALCTKEQYEHYTQTSKRNIGAIGSSDIIANTIHTVNM